MVDFSRLSGSPAADGPSNAELFGIIEDLARRLAIRGREDPMLLEGVIRLLDYERRNRLDDGLAEALSDLLFGVGYYQYLSSRNNTLLRQSVLSAHSAQGMDGRTLHSEQMGILLRLLMGQNVILSAPTSFGKSAIVDAYIAAARPKIIVAVVPTLALIDEMRRRMQRQFGSEYKIIYNNFDATEGNERVIYVLTQERLLSRDDISKIDFLFIDEFYKLDPLRDDQRFEYLNICVYKYSKLSKLIYMAGPHVDELRIDPRWLNKFYFEHTNFTTVAVDVMDRTSSPDVNLSFIEDLAANRSDPALVFCRSPQSAREVSEQILRADVYTGFSDPMMAAYAAWLKSAYHASWAFADSVERGVVLNHGKIPRAINQKSVQLFNEGVINCLVCTSTLIEGVNTVARNVFIYDKKINRTDFDFFSFANIRGRAGRMGAHLIGRVFLYHEPPKREDVFVEIPAFGDPMEVEDSLFLNLEPESGEEDVFRAREKQIVDRSSVDLSILREFSGLGLEKLEAAKSKIEELAVEDPQSLDWSGFPEKSQRQALAEIYFYAFHDPSRSAVGAHSPKQLRWFLEQLRSCKSIGSFLRWFVRTIGPGEDDARVERAFEFMKACEYTIPACYAAIEAIVEQVLDKEVNYKFYIQEIEHLFRPVWMKVLEEAGLPIPISERCRRLIDDEATPRHAAYTLEVAYMLGDLNFLSEIESEFVLAAVRSGG
jgi:hypothetical protein